MAITSPACPRVRALQLLRCKPALESGAPRVRRKLGNTRRRTQALWLRQHSRLPATTWPGATLCGRHRHRTLRGSPAIQQPVTVSAAVHSVRQLREWVQRTTPSWFLSNDMMWSPSYASNGLVPASPKSSLSSFPSWSTSSVSNTCCAQGLFRFV